MQLVFACPRCQRPNVAEDVESGRKIACVQCDWSREPAAGEMQDGAPRQCLVCGCSDLWRRKDFPSRLGLVLVTVQIVLSTIAWGYYRPLLAIGILMGFALVDLVLFLVMRDVLVCYRCGARHRQVPLDESIGPFNLETAERYRQEAARLRETAGS